jgi:acyl-CoA thioester hydrolase
MRSTNGRACFEISGMEKQVFRHCHRVGYAECTLGNHIYYARYLDLLERARGELFRHLGSTFLHWQEQDTIFPVIEARLKYKGAARYDDLLVIEVWLTELGRIRLRFAYRILDEANRILIEAETSHVCAGMNDKPKRVPEELSKLLEPYLEEAGQ